MTVPSFATKSKSRWFTTRCADSLQPPHWRDRSPASKKATASCSAIASSVCITPGWLSHGWDLKSSNIKANATSASMVLSFVMGVGLSVVDQGCADQHTEGDTPAISLKGGAAT